MGRDCDPYHPCMIYLYLGKYTSPMDSMGKTSNAFPGSCRG